MFNSTAEFEAKVRYYLAHEDERVGLVRNARRLVAERHEWRRRGADLVELISAALPEYRKRQHHERKNPVILPQLVELNGPGAEVSIVQRNHTRHTTAGGRESGHQQHHHTTDQMAAILSQQHRALPHHPRTLTLHGNANGAPG